MEKKFVFCQMLALCALLMMPTLYGQPERSEQKSKNAASWPIITRKGDKLWEGDKVFRFFGLAAPNIQQNETQLSPDNANRFPDDFEICDILSALNQLGARATRTFTLSIYDARDAGVPVYITKDRTYNEEAFKCLDRIIALSHEYDIRLIIPFIASQSFEGIRGADEFAALYGKPAGSFWTDPDVKKEFKHFLTYLLNRKNTVNGILYKDDPAVLAWQLGNEFGSYAPDRKLDYNFWAAHIQQWSSEMAAFIKSVDPNHLVMEAGGADRAAFLKDPNIDLISEHLYEYWNRLGGQPTELGPLALKAYAQCKGIKPLVIDEFGLGSVENLSTLMKTIRKSDIVGGLLWSIRSHRREGGWYYHNEGGTPVNTYHFPGSAIGAAYDETTMLGLLRREAYLIRGEKPHLLIQPTPTPVLKSLNGGFTWRGSTGASYYVLERAITSGGEWEVIATGLNDGIIANVKDYEHTEEAKQPTILFVDSFAERGKNYFYRIKAVNTVGESKYSNVVEVFYPGE